MSKRSLNKLSHVIENFLLFRLHSISSYYFRKWKQAKVLLPPKPISKYEQHRHWTSPAEIAGEQQTQLNSGRHDSRQRKKVCFSIQDATNGTGSHIGGGNLREMKNTLLQKNRTFLRRIIHKWSFISQQRRLKRIQKENDQFFGEIKSKKTHHPVESKKKGKENRAESVPTTTK